MKKILITTLLLAVSTQSFAVQFVFREPFHGVKASAESPAYNPSDNDTSDIGDTNKGENIPDPVAQEQPADEEGNPWFAFIEEKCGGIASNGSFSCTKGFRGELPTAPYPYENVNDIAFFGNSYTFTNLDAFASITNLKKLDIASNTYLKSVSGLRNIKNTDIFIDYDFEAAKREGFIKVPSNTPFCDDFMNGYLCK